MRILRVRRGFQADHSSSSYLFYAVDHPVSAEGQAIAHRFSSRAEVDKHSARYVKWGETSLRSNVFEALLDEHYDVMAEESYNWWTLMIAVPKTSESKAILAPFTYARGDNEQGVEVVEYRQRLAVTISCQFQANGAYLGTRSKDPLESLVKLLAKIREDLLEGNTSFLRAVAEFYYGLDEDEGDEKETSDDRETSSSSASIEGMSKAELQQECEARGITFRKSWTKAQLQEALPTSGAARTPGKSKKGKPKLSRAAETIVRQLE
jgi:hypothetical protein